MRTTKTAHLIIGTTIAVLTHLDGRWGAVCQLPIDRKFFYEYGIQVKSIGTTLYYPHDSEKRKIQIIYLNLPANIGYKWNFTNHLKGFAGTGVYLAYGVWGKETGKGIDNYGPYIIDDRVQFKNENPSQVTPTNIIPSIMALIYLRGWAVKEYRFHVSLTGDFVVPLPIPAYTARGLETSLFQ